MGDPPIIGGNSHCWGPPLMFWGEKVTFRGKLGGKPPFSFIFGVPPMSLGGPSSSGVPPMSPVTPIWGPPLYWGPSHILRSLPYIGVPPIYWGPLLHFGVSPMFWGPPHRLGSLPYIGAPHIHWAPPHILGSPYLVPPLLGSLLCCPPLTAPQNMGGGWEGAGISWGSPHSLYGGVPQNPLEGTPKLGGVGGFGQWWGWDPPFVLRSMGGTPQYAPMVGGPPKTHFWGGLMGGIPFWGGSKGKGMSP